MSPFVASADYINAGESVRIDFQSSDWIFMGTGDDLGGIYPRLSFCETPVLGTGFTGNEECDYNTADDIFQLSFYSSLDELLYTQFNPANGSQAGNTWANNINAPPGVTWPRDGYVLFDLLEGALFFNQVLLIGVESDGFVGVQSGLLNFAVIRDDPVSVSVSVPGTVTLFGIGLLGIGLAWRKKA